ncbi:hypothetical protein Cantr_00478 [Candida viswanathii]|uniref:Uncharacterized protein n=1 Tax=Candida viswanathii TaxID=5486 RepID=A0A367YF21_9ASCO|nr:hypothetical protein Cantr_00478 [Candida viswanathii]
MSNPRGLRRWGCSVPAQPGEVDHAYCGRARCIYDSFKDKFDDDWFGVLDSLKVDQLRDKLDRDLHEQGVFQQCFQLLPFFQNILVKLGKDGVLLVSLCTSVEDYKSIPTTSEYRPSYIRTAWA